MTRNNPFSIKIKRLTFAALYLALALVLPFITGQVPQIGAMLCPMHLPVLLCGFMCGWTYGIAVGFIAPLLRSVLFGMPALFPSAVGMAFELAAYGGLSGWLYASLPRNKGMIYISLLLSMLGGRVVWGVARYCMAGLSGSSFPMSAFIAGAVTNAVPGIILQIVLIPLLVMAMERAGLSLNVPAREEKGDGV